jgi:hypothetical protein
MNGAKACVKWNKPDWEKQILHILSHMRNLDLYEWHQCKNGDCLEWEPMWGKRVKVEGKGDEYDRGIIKSIKSFKKWQEG